MVTWKAWSEPPLQELAARSTNISLPGPIAIPASQTWDGNDGPWSSFFVQVGSPAQDLKVFIGTSCYQTIVVVPAGCVSFDPSNCASLRGEEFEIDQSSTWINNTASLSSNVYPLEVEVRLGFDINGEYGFDDVTLGYQGGGGPFLSNQTVGGFAAKDFYLGLFGLTPRPTNFSTYGHPIPSFMENLRTNNIIPSTSWSYTAGNQYRLNQVPGSLILGGYDTSKFIPNNLTFSFNEIDTIDLTVNILDISFSNSTLANLSLLLDSDAPLPAFIDSSIPHLWLPIAVCDLFSEAFGLTYDPDLDLYLVNDTQHTILTNSNPSVAFILGNLSSDATVQITLPYKAFDLQISSPIVENPAYYFPLKQAANNTQYTLGRTFLQEAYLTADYERRIFSVSQCSWVAGAKENLVAILPPSLLPSSAAQLSVGHSVSHGAIAGIVVGCVAGAFIVAWAIFFWVKLRRRPPSSDEPIQPNTTEALTDIKAAPEEFRKPELDSEGVMRRELDSTSGNKIERFRSELYAGEEAHELPAREEVAAEMAGSSRPTELLSP